MRWFLFVLGMVVATSLFALPKKELKLKYNEIVAGKATSIDFDKKYFIESLSLKVLPVDNYGSADVYVNGKRVGKLFGIKEKGEVSFDLRVKEATDSILFVGDKDDKNATLKITAIEVEAGEEPAKPAAPARSITKEAPVAPPPERRRDVTYKCNYTWTMVTDGNSPVLEVKYNQQKSQGTTSWYRGDSLEEALGDACRACAPGSKTSSVVTSSFRTTTTCSDPVCISDAGKPAAADVAQAHATTLCGNGKAEGHGPVPISPSAKTMLDDFARRRAEVEKANAEDLKRLQERHALDEKRKNLGRAPNVEFRNSQMSLNGN